MRNLLGKPIGISNLEAFGTVVWLLENTSLSFQQIADYMGISRFDVSCIADDEIVPRPKPLDPLLQGWIDPIDLEQCEKNNTQNLLKPWHWKNASLEKCEESSFLDGKILSTQITKLAYLTYGRNACHSTWITRYYREGSISFCSGVLQSKSERLRTQGSVFRIEEIPALSLQTDSGTFFIVEINHTHQMDLFMKELSGPLFLQRIIKLVKNKTENSIMCLQSSDRIIPPKLSDVHRFRRFQSLPRGSARSLSWKKSFFDSSYDVSRFEKLNERFLESQPLTSKIWDALGGLPSEARMQPSQVKISISGLEHRLHWGNDCCSVVLDDV